MGICSAVDCTAALQALVSCPFDHRRDKRLALSTVFDTDECPRAGAVPYQVQLNALPPIYWQIVMVGQKNTGSTLKTWPVQKTAD